MHGGVIDDARLDAVVVLLEDELVHPDHHVRPRVQPRLLAGGALFDALLGHAGFDGLGHPAKGLHLLDHLQRLVVEVVGQGLHHVAPRPGVHNLGDAGLVLHDELGVARDACREVRGQRNRLVEGVGVERLGPAHDRGHALDRRAHDVVVRVLRLEGVAGGLGVGAEQERLLLLGVEVLLHHVRPEPPRRAQLRHLHVEVHADPEEEGEARRERVHGRPGRAPSADVLDAVSDGEPQLEVGGRPSLLHVVPRDGDGVVLGHAGGAVAHDVRDDPERGPRGVDVRVARHVLLENVVLDGPRQLLARDARLLRGADPEGEDREDSAVHGHRNRHLPEVDAVEEDLHVLDGVDGDAGHAHVSADARVVRVVPAVGREVEGDREPLSARGDRPLVERVRLLGSGEASVLPDSPRAVRVHGSVRPARVGVLPGEEVADVVLGRLDVRPRVDRLDRDALGGVPREAGGRVRELGLLRCHLDPLVRQRDRRHGAGELGHGAPRRVQAQGGCARGRQIDAAGEGALHDVSTRRRRTLVAGAAGGWLSSLPRRRGALG
mmetsp:Transcript_40575/g.96083  ORF Transcript_40575/g.96083 Transcript_40575/m.96083 type:complete len:549 (-) Transcript_40575:32-1678(-)